MKTWFYYLDDHKVKMASLYISFDMRFQIGVEALGVKANAGQDVNNEVW